MLHRSLILYITGHSMFYAQGCFVHRGSQEHYAEDLVLELPINLLPIPDRLALELPTALSNVIFLPSLVPFLCIHLGQGGIKTVTASLCILSNCPRTDPEVVLAIRRGAPAGILRFLSG